MIRELSSYFVPIMILFSIYVEYTQFPSVRKSISNYKNE